jgi:hypothetical protein
VHTCLLTPAQTRAHHTHTHTHTHTPACRRQNIKRKHPLVLSRVNALLERLHALGPAAAIDVDQAALRVTLDVIGLVRACVRACVRRVE